MTRSIKFFLIVLTCIILVHFLSLSFFIAQSVFAQNQDFDVREVTLNVPIEKTSTFSNVDFVPCGMEDGKQKMCLQIPWIAEYIGLLYRYAVVIGSVLAVLIIMIGGVLYMISGMNPSSITKAKNMIIGAVTGLVLLLGSYAVLYIVNPNLVNLRAIELPIVETVDMVCCENSEGNANFQFASQSLNNLENKTFADLLFLPALADSGDDKATCPSKTVKTSADKCLKNSLNQACCLDENSPSYQECKTAGGICSPVGSADDASCKDAAEFIGVSSALLPVSMVLPVGSVASSVKAGFETFKVGGKVLGKIALKCTKSKICRTAVVTGVSVYNFLKAAAQDLNCKDDAVGVCLEQKNDTLMHLPNGDWCQEDKECSSGTCCKSENSLACWTGMAYMGICVSGEPGPVASASKCDVNDIGAAGGSKSSVKIGEKNSEKVGNWFTGTYYLNQEDIYANVCCVDEYKYENGVKDDVVCAGYSLTGSVFIFGSTENAACSTGQKGESCVISKDDSINQNFCEGDTFCSTAGVCIGNTLEEGDKYLCQFDKDCPSNAYCTTEYDNKSAYACMHKAEFVQIAPSDDSVEKAEIEGGYPYGCIDYDCEWSDKSECIEYDPGKFTKKNLCVKKMPKEDMYCIFDEQCSTGNCENQTCK